jgi:hypothetical protein
LRKLFHSESNELELEKKVHEYLVEKMKEQQKLYPNTLA